MCLGVTLCDAVTAQCDAFKTGYGVGVTWVRTLSSWHGRCTYPKHEPQGSARWEGGRVVKQAVSTRGKESVPRAYTETRETETRSRRDSRRGPERALTEEDSAQSRLLESQTAGAHPSQTVRGPTALLPNPQLAKQLGHFRGTLAGRTGPTLRTRTRETSRTA